MNHTREHDLVRWRATRRGFLGTVGAGVALSPLAFAESASAIIMPPTSRPFRRMGTLGVTAGELLRVSLFRHHDPEIPDAPCNYRIRLPGLAGELLGESKGEIAAERGALADFDLTAGHKAGERVQCHVEVELDTFLPVGSSAEVVDTRTGMTTASPDEPCNLPAPSLVELGTVGVAAGQLARVSVFHHEEAGAVGPPCDFAIELLGLDGKALGEDAGSLAPGKGAFFDYDLAAGLAKAERAQFHPDVHMPPNPQGGLPMLGATLEIFDPKTGRTAVPTNPCNITDLAAGQ